MHQHSCFEWKVRAARRNDLKSQFRIDIKLQEDCSDGGWRPLFASKAPLKGFNPEVSCWSRKDGDETWLVSQIWWFSRHKKGYRPHWSQCISMDYGMVMLCYACIHGKNLLFYTLWVFLGQWGVDWNHWIGMAMVRCSCDSLRCQTWRCHCCHQKGDRCGEIPFFLETPGNNRRLATIWYIDVTQLYICTFFWNSNMFIYLYTQTM